MLFLGNINSSSVSVSLDGNRVSHADLTLLSPHSNHTGYFRLSLKISTGFTHSIGYNRPLPGTLKIFLRDINGKQELIFKSVPILCDIFKNNEITVETFFMSKTRHFIVIQLELSYSEQHFSAHIFSIKTELINEKGIMSK